MSAPRNREHLLIEAVAHGRSIEKTAEYAGTSERVVKARLNNPEFMQRVRRERARMHSETSTWLLSWSKHCGNYLFSVVSDPTQTTTTRIKAAQVLLTEARHWIDADVIERLTELEDHAGMTFDA